MADLPSLSSFLNDASGAILLEQFRQQVSNLMAAVHLVTPALRERDDPKFDRYLAIMNQSFYRMLRLINHMELAQDFTKGGVLFRPAALDLAGLCRETADLAAPLCSLAGVRLRYEEDCATLLTTGDAALLRQLLLLLFSNAIRAAAEGGEAGLHLSRQKDRALLTVWDNGPGFSPPSASPSSMPYRPDGALGLGLPIARELARLHGGAVMLESRPERGTRAVVSLPIRPPETSVGLKTPPPAGELNGGFSLLLLELADVLPFEAFLPEDLE